MELNRDLIVTLPKGGFAPTAAAAIVRTSGLEQELRTLAPGPFGLTSRGAGILEVLVEAVDLGLMAASALEGVIRDELMKPGSFETVALEPAHHRIIAAFQLTVTADEAARGLARWCPVPEVEGALELEGVEDLLAQPDAEDVAGRATALCRVYLQRKWQTRPISGAASEDEDVGTMVSAGLQLLRNAVGIYARNGALRAMLGRLAERRVVVAGFPYAGLSQQAPTESPAGLLPMRPEHIVGNEEFLAAGLRLARDVAGYDMGGGYNPKKVNPVLFGLGSPGCGKTVTAHAVGNYFLDYCRQRNIPARFVVVRRSDWASSYQNASAANLIRIFREEVYGFDGVAGVYWPDIDTALASRANNDLRSEEKQNLGAVFGIFDGTLLPRDGKWFMICDANTMHMDEAAISRIAQSPHTVRGPTSPAHYVRLIRDLMLGDLREFLPQEDDEWERIGAFAADHGLSGRSVQGICGNIRAVIQDFEYPDEYFSADADARRAMIARLSRPMDEGGVTEAMERWRSFNEEAQRREEEARFEQEVNAVVRQLNAGRAAVERAATLGVS